MLKSKPEIRITYAFVSLVQLILIVLIALFIRDRFIRPYGGDILVTAFICSVVRIIFPATGRLTHDLTVPICVFIFATAVETGQYFGMVSVLGLDDIPLLRIALGNVFSPADLVCYAAGCVIFTLCEYLILLHNNNNKGDTK